MLLMRQSPSVEMLTSGIDYEVVRKFIKEFEEVVEQEPFIIGPIIDEDGIEKVVSKYADKSELKTPYLKYMETQVKTVEMEKIDKARRNVIIITAVTFITFFNVIRN